MRRIPACNPNSRRGLAALLPAGPVLLPFQVRQGLVVQLQTNKESTAVLFSSVLSSIQPCPPPVLNCAGCFRLRSQLRGLVQRGQDHSRAKFSGLACGRPVCEFNLDDANSLGEP